MVLPGPEARQLAACIGWLMHCTAGCIRGGTLFVLPSLCILIVLSVIYQRFGDVAAVAGVFYDIKPAVTALVLHAVRRIGLRALLNRWMWGLAAATFVAIFAFDAPLQAIVLAAGLIGQPAHARLIRGRLARVLPCVYEGAVDQHHWLSGAQMIDGLAPGETTSGPLIMVVALVDFVGGWPQQVLGPQAPFLGGALAASMVTFFTFLPSFVFILAGGPVVEATTASWGSSCPRRPLPPPWWA